jgi:hypothetical protein
MAGAPVAAIAALAVVFLVAGGLGYACSSGGLNEHGSSPPPAVLLSWVSPESSAPSAGYVHCSSSFTAEVLSIRVTDLAPATFCAVSGTIKNLGNLPLTLRAVITLTEPAGCAQFAYSDNVAGLTKEPVLDPERLFGYHADFSLSAKAGNICEGKSASVLVNIAGSNPCESTLAAAAHTRTLSEV